MEGLVGLYEAFSKEGTFLDIEKECHYIKFLMNFWEKEIKEHPTLFFDMVERIDISHQQNLFEAPSYREVYYNFAYYLMKIRAFFPEQKDFLGMVVENIRAEVWQVEISIKDFNSYTKLIRRETASIPEYNLLFLGCWIVERLWERCSDVLTIFFDTEKVECLRDILDYLWQVIDENSLWNKEKMQQYYEALQGIDKSILEETDFEEKAIYELVRALEVLLQYCIRKERGFESTIWQAVIDVIDAKMQMDGKDIHTSEGFADEELQYEMECLRYILYFSQESKKHSYDKQLFSKGRRIHLNKGKVLKIVKVYQEQYFPKLVGEEVLSHIQLSPRFGVEGDIAWIITGEHNFLGDVWEQWYVVSDITEEVDNVFDKFGNRYYPHKENLNKR